MAAKKKSPKRTASRRSSKRAPVKSFSAEEFRHKAYTLPEMVKGLNQFMSLSELSRETGIPRTTLRRYRDGGKPSVELGELYRGILESGFQIMHREVVRKKASARTVNAVGKARRVHRYDPRDPKRKRKIASDSVDRAVMTSADRAIFNTLKRAAQRSRLLGIPGFVRFLMLGNETDPQYPGEYFWSEPEALSELTEKEIADVIAEARARGTLILMRVQDREE